MARISSKPSMKNALQGSLQSEKQSFAERLAKADEKFAEPTSVAALPANEVEAPVAPAPVTKVVREAFTIPEPEHKQIDVMRGKLLLNAVASTKSEVVRAGLLLLSELNDADLVEVISRLERVKTGRPKAG